MIGPRSTTSATESDLSRIVRGAKEAFRTGEFGGSAAEVAHLPALVIRNATEVGTFISLRITKRPASGLDTPLPRLAEGSNYSLCYFFDILWSHDKISA